MWYQLSDGRTFDMNNFRAIEPVYTHEGTLVCIKCTHSNGNFTLFTGRAASEIMAYVAQNTTSADELLT